jgi:stearoyl-CoA desaturase (delta-9 desaturase)
MSLHSSGLAFYQHAAYRLRELMGSAGDRHLGWIFSRKHSQLDLVKVADLARYPELMHLHKYEFVPAVALGAVCFLVAGWSGLVVGFFWSTVLLYHATFCINSLAHVHRSTRYVTGDDSRNNWLLAFFTMGEGWHNNHHAYQSSVRQGFRWWEIDPTYYLLKVLAWLGIVSDLKTPPEAVLRNEQRLGTRVINRAAGQLAARFNPEGIAAAALGPDLAALQERLVRARDRTTEVVGSLHLPAMPTREKLVREAKAMFARTRSLDEIVDHAYELLLNSVLTRLPATKG